MLQREDQASTYKLVFDTLWAARQEFERITCRLSEVARDTLVQATVYTRVPRQSLRNPQASTPPDRRAREPATATRGHTPATPLSAGTYSRSQFVWKSTVVQRGSLDPLRR